MTSIRITRRRIRRRTWRRQSWPLAAPEMLELRTLLAGSIQNGTYVEDFALNTDMTQPGWDDTGAFQDRLTYVADGRPVFDLIWHTLASW